MGRAIDSDPDSEDGSTESASTVQPSGIPGSSKFVRRLTRWKVFQASIAGYVRAIRTALKEADNALNAQAYDATVALIEAMKKELSEAHGYTPDEAFAAM